MNEALRVRKRVEELERRVTELEELIKQLAKRKKPGPKPEHGKTE